MTGDPHFNDVSLLLHCDGVDGSTAFTDSSNLAKAITAANGAQVDTAQSKWGGASGLFTNTGVASETAKHLAFTPSPVHYPSSGDFTVEFWARPAAAPSTAGGLYQVNRSVGQWAAISISHRSNGGIEWYVGRNNPTTTPSSIPNAGTLTVGVWSHVALSVSGTSGYCFVNGALVTTLSIPDRPAASTAAYIGAMTPTSYGFNGHIDDVRVTQGVARYTAAFTPPTAVFADETGITGDPNFGSVKLLLHCDGADGSTTITDSSGNPVTVTPNSNAQIDTAQSKFGGASLLIDGTYDAISLPGLANLGAGDWTLEWFYRSFGTPEAYGRVFQTRNGDTMAGISLNQENANQVYLYADATASGGWDYSGPAVTFSPNVWQHFALVRKAGTISLYIDGVAYASTTVIPANDSAQTWIFGGQTINTSRSVRAHFDEIRFTQGVARYAGSFVPPAAPFPNEATAGEDANFADVALLLHMDGADGSTTFTDSSSNAVAVTAVGNAQLDNAQIKFGPTAGYFDGTGDYLTCTLPENFNQDFTIEGFYYPQVGQDGGVILESRTSDSNTTGFIIYRRSSDANRLTFGYWNGSSFVTAASVAGMTAGQWWYYLVKRVGNTVTVYLNGVAGGNCTVTTTLSNTAVRIGASWSGGEPVKGWLDEMRITTGVARSGSTIPAVPFPDSSDPGPDPTGFSVSGTAPSGARIAALTAAAPFSVPGFAIAAGSVFNIDLGASGDDVMAIVMDKYGTRWQAATDYIVGDRIRPTVGKETGFAYEVVVAGNSGATEPVWGTSGTQSVGTATVTPVALYGPRAVGPVEPIGSAPAPELWTPAELTSALWLDAADASTITEVSSEVVQWADKSGNARHFLPVTGAAKFVIQSADINGLNTMRASGTRSAMAPALVNFVAKVIVMVWKWRNPNSTYEHPWESAGDFHGSSSGSINSSVFGNLGGKYGWNSNLRRSGEDIGMTAGNLLRSSVAQQFSLTIASTPIANFLELGSSGASFPTRSPSVNYAEVLVFEGALTVTEFELLEGYLAWKWGLEGDLPPAHPYKAAAPVLTP